MESKTKFIASIEQIRAAFQAAKLGEIKDIEELSDGWFNRIFSAVDMRGKKYVIKFAPPKDALVLTHEKNMMVSEVNCYRLLEEKTDIKTAKVIHSDFSESIIPTAYFIMEFLDGMRLDKAKLTKDDNEKVSDKIAWILSEFHKIEGNGYGYEQVGLKDNWKEGLRHMTQILIDDCAFFNKKCKIGKKLLTYIEKCSFALENVPCVLVHYDLHNMNVFYNKKNSGEIELAVLDLERYYYGDALGDFIVQDFGKPISKKSILQHYNKYAKHPILIGKNEEIRFQLMNAYLAVVVYTERFSRFRSFGKFFNSIYLMETASYLSFGISSFSKLKRLAK